MNCNSIQKLFTEYISEHIDKENKKKVEAHLNQCDECTNVYTSMKTAWLKMDTLPQEGPGPALRSRFYTMLEQAKKSQAESKSKMPLHERFTQWLHIWWPQKPSVQFAFSMLCILIGFAFGHLMKNNISQNGELSYLRQEIHDMRQMMSLSLLEQSSSSDRLLGVNLSTQIDQPDQILLDQLLQKINHDPNINVRLAAINATTLFIRQNHVREHLIESLANQTSPLVQIELIDLLAQIREQKALNALKMLIQNENIDPTVRDHARRRLNSRI